MSTSIAPPVRLEPYDQGYRDGCMQLARMADIGGCRAIVPAGGFVAITRLMRRIDRSVNLVVDVKDYIATPKDTGYRAVHVIARRDDHLVEIQLRTARQHAWAEYVERWERTQATR